MKQRPCSLDQKGDQQLSFKGRFSWKLGNWKRKSEFFLFFHEILSQLGNDKNPELEERLA